MFIFSLKIALTVITLLILLYTIRHYVFTLNRLFGRQRHPYINIDTATWPSVTVLVAAHNEEAVVAHCMDALLGVSYPSNKLKIMVVNDRSTDRTKQIVDEYVERFAGRIVPFHRTHGKPGKASALKDAMQLVESEIIIVFDADYIPGRGLIKQLASPFFDPEVGLVMGRVVPINAGHNMLTRLLDLERAGGYQVDQQARMNMDFVPQYGGTVGGIRIAALDSVGGWIDDTLAEDTDLTYRAILKGWKSVYQNRSECYEEVPENWPVRIRQIARWTKGHNQVLYRYSLQCLMSRNISLNKKIDALFLLGIYAMSPIIMLGWVIAILLFYMGENGLIAAPIALMTITIFGTVGNCAAFFEIAAAVHLDKGTNRIRLLPLNFCSFLISTITVSNATFAQILKGSKASQTWEKTPRFRKQDFELQ